MIDEIKEVLNVVYGDDINLAYTWVTDNLSNEIKSYCNTPPNKGEHGIKYIVEFDNDECYKLVKRFEKLKSGYVYNTYSKKDILLYKISIIKFSGETENIQKSILYNNLNNEINNRVIRSLDKESMYQVFNKVQNVITSKSNWNYTEYNNILTEILKTFRKDFYSSIAKRAKKYGKNKGNQI